ncbi:hypothetical protein Pmani_017638 [Petrolisthes manimaculis]|uniref:Uncharacterized protein n=1 Tax=Petrolisthes manimaculis TaxID=1843537 RepID=A0AAE1PP53_9EUCA|nr:hypothetical protein Pmani_017638 [Petrolisthes manimaculis]
MCDIFGTHSTLRQVNVSTATVLKTPYKPFYKPFSRILLSSNNDTIPHHHQFCNNNNTPLHQQQHYATPPAVQQQQQYTPSPRILPPLPSQSLATTHLTLCM